MLRSRGGCARVRGTARRFCERWGWSMVGAWQPCLTARRVRAPPRLPVPSHGVGALAGESPKIRRRTHVASGCRIVLVRPHYPENLGAVARAMRVTGFADLLIVSPRPLVSTQHAHARKMAVGALPILDNARIVDSLDIAIDGCSLVLGTSARAGSSRVQSPRSASSRVVEACLQSLNVAVVFGDERTGLRKRELERCTDVVRIPMVANEPSLNLAQAAMVILYEILVQALEQPDHHAG